MIGLGLLGQLVVQYCRLAGARTIVAIDPVAARRELALAHGATACPRVDAGAAREPVAEADGGRMLDAVFDVTGHPAVLAPASASCASSAASSSSATRRRRRAAARPGRRLELGRDPRDPRARAAGGGLRLRAVERRAVAEVFFDFLLQRRLRVADL